MMNTEQNEDDISEMLRVDLNFFNMEYKFNVNALNLSSDLDVIEMTQEVLIEKGYFKKVVVGSRRKKEESISLYRVFTYKELDFDSGRLLPFSL